MAAKVDVAALRSKIENTRAEVARAEGEAETLQGEIDSHMSKLRTVLGCKTGAERQAVNDLREKIAADEAEITRLADEADRIKEGRGDEPQAEEDGA